MTEKLILTANLALMGIVLVPAGVLIGAVVHAVFSRRRRRIEWVEIAGLGEIPVLKE